MEKIGRLAPQEHATYTRLLEDAITHSKEAIQIQNKLLREIALESQKMKWRYFSKPRWYSELYDRCSNDRHLCCDRIFQLQPLLQTASAVEQGRSFYEESASKIALAQTRSSEIPQRMSNVHAVMDALSDVT